MARIALVHNTTWSIWNFRLPLLQFLSDQGHEVIVLAAEDEYSSRIPWKFYPVKMASCSTNPVSDYFILRDLKYLFKKTCPDIVLLYNIKPNIYGNFAARGLCIPTISTITGLGSLYIRRRPTTIVANLLYRFSLKHPHRVFFHNKDDCQQFTADDLVQPAQAMLLPGSGIDLERFKPLPELQKHKNDKPIVFLLICRMLWDKGVAEYAAAAKTLLSHGVKVRCQLLGVLEADNPEALTQKDMDELVNETGVEYLGFSDLVEKEIETADCIVLPSYREGLPRSLLEAAAMAKPIITTNVPGCRDAVDDGVTGYLCEPRDVDDLYQKMNDMLMLSSKARHSMGALGRKKMKREFDQRFVFEKYVKAIDEVFEN